MKKLQILLLIFLVSGCATVAVDDNRSDRDGVVSVSSEQVQCVGTVEPPAELEDKLAPINDDRLLAAALGKLDEGGLCQGNVYQVTDNFTIFRAWNSTNPNSEMGQWWAFTMPQGKVSQYRADYEICYQWSPLDRLTQCSLNRGAKIVMGTGQSAQCSQYLTYPASPEIQVYIEASATLVSDCLRYVDEFDWKPVVD